MSSKVWGGGGKGEGREGGGGKRERRKRERGGRDGERLVYMSYTRKAGHEVNVVDLMETS